MCLNTDEKFVKNASEWLMVIQDVTRSVRFQPSLSGFVGWQCFRLQLQPLGGGRPSLCLSTEVSVCFVFLREKKEVCWAILRGRTEPLNSAANDWLVNPAPHFICNASHIASTKRCLFNFLLESLSWTVRRAIFLVTWPGLCASTKENANSEEMRRECLMQ